MGRDESLSRGLMLLCFGGALVLFCLSWRSPVSKFSQSRLKLRSEVSQTIPTLAANSSRILVDLSDRRVYLYRQDKLVANYPIAVGQAGWETPIGSFRVKQMYRHPSWRQPITGEVVASGPNNPLGDRWIGFWSDGHHQIGFHGTNDEKQIGQAVSHGCLRMRNQDIRALYQQIGQGTLVIVRE